MHSGIHPQWDEARNGFSIQSCRGKNLLVLYHREVCCGSSCLDSNSNQEGDQPGLKMEACHRGRDP